METQMELVRTLCETKLNTPSYSLAVIQYVFMKRCYISFTVGANNLIR